MPDPEVTIRAQRVGDRAAVRAVITAAFAHHPVVPDVAEALSASPGARLGWVAEVGQDLVGHVQLSRGWLDAPRRLVEVLILSPLSVAPEWQRLGIGARLVRHAIGHAAEQGSPALFLEGSPAYYGQFGFAAAGELGFDPPSTRIPEPAFQVVRLPGYEPWMTGRLVYPEAFWTYDCVGLREPG